MESINRNNIFQHLVEYELELSGKTILNIIDDDRWRFNFTITLVQYDKFKFHAVSQLKKVFKIPKRKAENIFKWFDQNFGLRLKN